MKKLQEDLGAGIGASVIAATLLLIERLAA